MKGKHMSTYAIIMIVGVIVVAGGWIAYLIWDYKQRKEEESQPKPQSQRVQKTKTELSDWAKKMAEFKGPPKRPAAGGGT
jgi:predicted negative regulator of RcsB-dependent stress response